LKNFGSWYQQLWAESLAKTHTRSGQVAPRVSTPMSAVGAADQHSILQQVMEGAKDKFVVFMRVEESEAGSQKLIRHISLKRQTYKVEQWASCCVLKRWQHKKL